MNSKKTSLDRPCIFCAANAKSLHKIAENKDFFAVVDGAPLAKGHMLLIPKEHISCYGKLPHAREKEFFQIKEEIINFLQKHYGRIIIFEHGIAGQTVFHAHLHFLPTYHKILPHILKERRVQKIKDFSELKSYFKSHKKYLFLQEDDNLYIISSVGVPKGYFHTYLLPELLQRPKEAALRTKEAAPFFEEVKTLWEKDMVH